jgi:Ca2+/H+ antiporter, TMEM165/GDT1 family
MWEYLTVFVMAATPLLELLVVIPIGIGYGLHPVPVAFVVFLGNTLPVLGIVLLFEQWRAWRVRRAAAAAQPGGVGEAESGRQRRARDLWRRYGLAGLALLAPLLTGVHLAAVMALALGSPRRATAAWMTASIAVWTVGVTAVTVAGIEGFRFIVR